MRLCMWGHYGHNNVQVFPVVLATAAERKVTLINSILCPGLGISVGCVPYD